MTYSHIGDLLARQSARYQDKTFLIVPEDGRTFSYAQFDAAVNRTARALQRLDVGHGDKVGILTANVPEFLFAFFGAMKVGAVAAPVNYLLKPGEIQFILGHCGAKVLLTTPSYHELVAPVRSELPDLRHVIIAGGDCPPGALRFEQILAEEPDAPPTAPVDGGDEAVILYTSGTTGKPKGVLLTHANLITDSAFIARWHRLGEADRTTCILPLFHVNGEVISTITPLYSGGSVVLPERFSASRFWPDVARYRPNWFSAAPTVLTILLNASESAGDLPDRGALRFCVCGTAPLPVELHRRFERTFGIMVFEGYGLTECTCRATFNPHPPEGAGKLGESDGYRKIGSVGLPIGGEVQVFDDDDRELPSGMVGEVVLRGPNVMKGYFRDPLATAEAMRSGWLHTGDLGYVDVDGYLYITDRKKDMIIRGGENIYPREVDEVLYQHPAVAQAAAVGLPDAKYGEEVAAFVVLKAGERVAESDIVAFCRGRLADYKCPKSVRFLADIPKGPTGKLLRRKLRELYLEG